MTEYNIAIIGGGANGVSVLNELVNQLSELNNSGKFKITLYEKSGVYGTGLAYGTHLDAHILNMPAETMSAVGGEPAHFMEWLKQPHDPDLHPYFNTHAQGTDFVPRAIFGMYLQEMYRGAIKKAEQAGVSVSVLNEEVFDVAEERGGVTVSSNGRKMAYDQTVLCLGNQPSTFGRHLTGLPGYFPHAWPEQVIMDGVPDSEDVYVVGSSLTAIDTFITLQEKGHTGKITLVSRHGILPKIRVPAEPYELNYVTPENLANLTAGGHKLSLDEVSELFIKEFEAVGVDTLDLSEAFSLSAKPAIEVLKKDIELLEHGNLQYFDVLKAIDEVVGDVWNALSLEDKGCFDARYKTIWNAYDYPMPIQNARKVSSALASGQLSIESDFKDISYDSEGEGFVIKCFDQDKPHAPKVHKTKYVINATGQGLNISEMRSPIIQNTLKGGTISPHLLGGIDVDFDSCAVRQGCGDYSNRLYAIGSLTRGVHFYTNSINENSKCGKRAVTHLVQKAMEEKPMPEVKRLQKIALFIGSDISSHLLMNDLVPQMIEEGFQPSIYFTKHRPSKKAVLHDIATQGFFERSLLADHIYPFLDSNPIHENAACHSPKQISEIYGITVKEIESVNDPDFINELEEEGIQAGVVVRCYQKFGKDIIGFFNRAPENALWNLHPGILPYYRGVMTYFRSMDDGQSEAGYSLHVIDEEWDAGPVIDVRPQPLDLSQAMLTNYCAIAPSGVPIIIENLKKLRSGEPIEAIPQSDEEKGYHTFPTKSEMKAFKKKGLALVDMQYMRSMFAENFSRPNTPHHQQLSKAVDLAIFRKTGIDVGGHYGYLTLGLPG